MFRYLTDCINAPGFEGMTYAEAGDAIDEMTATAKDITRSTFLRHINRRELRQIEDQLGYARRPQQGLTMAGDWHVGYHKGRFHGRPVYYFDHSRIEYIFAERQPQVQKL